MTDLHNIGSLLGLAQVVLLGEQRDDGLGQLDLLLLLLGQRGPDYGEHQHPQVACHVRVAMRHLCHRSHHVLHLIGACGATQCFC